MTQKEIEALLDKYMDGDTSANEEQALRSYFASCGNDIPEEWCIYKALFGYVAEERYATETSTEKPHILTFKRFMEIAACIALLVSICLSLGKDDKNYMIADGIKTTDKVAIENEIDKALTLVSVDNELIFSALQMLNEE
jgi:hypothetical protein